MIDTHQLKKRDLYLNKILAFQDTEPVKVVTGIRRCGKSSLLKLMTLHLKENGIAEDQILEMNFESYAFKNMNSDSFYQYVREHIIPNKRMYLSSMRSNASQNGKMPSILFGWISTVIFMSLVPTPICFPPNMRPTCPADA